MLALDPVPRAAGDIRRPEPLANDALEAKLAGVVENDIATLRDMLIELHRPGGFADQLGKCALALLERSAAQVFAAELKQVKSKPGRPRLAAGGHSAIGRISECRPRRR
jgi:hypothetical protein